MRVTVRKRLYSNKQAVWTADIRVIAKGTTTMARFRLVAPDAVTSQAVAKRWAMEQARLIMTEGPPHSTKQAREDRKVKESVRAAAKVPTFAEWAPVFLAHLEGERRKPTTLLARRSILNNHLLPTLGPLALTECGSNATITKLRTNLASISAARLNIAMAQLQQMLSIAAARYPSVKVPDVVYLKTNKRRTLKHFTSDQRDRLLASLDVCPVRWQVIVLLMIDAGLRGGEVAALHWAGVDFEARAIEVSGTMARGGVLSTTKTGLTRKVPMSARLRAALLKHTRSHELVVTAARSPRPLAHTSLVRTWEAVLRRAGLPRLSPHKGRHTFATSLLRTGSDLATVRDLLGHLNIRTTAGYLHSDEDTARSAIERLESVTPGALNTSLEPLHQ